MQEDIYFINENGEKVSVENVMSHIGIANIMMEKDSKLKEEFLNSGEQNPINFLISNKHHMAVSEMGYHKKVTYDSANMSDINKKILQYYKEEGYSSTDYELERRMMQRMERGE